MSYEAIAERFVLSLIQEKEPYSMSAPSSTQQDWDICYFTESMVSRGLYDIHYVQVKSVNWKAEGNPSMIFNLQNAIHNKVEYLYLVIYNYPRIPHGPAVYKFPINCFKEKNASQKFELIDSNNCILYGITTDVKKTVALSSISSPSNEKMLNSAGYTIL
jgi:hypothetical protein